MNSIGNIFRLTSFGESHGRAVGGVIDGIPAGATLSLAAIQEALDRRRPGTAADVSQRREKDRLVILSGVMALSPDGEILPLDDDTDTVVTLGTPIGFYVANDDCRSGDYDSLRDTFRPNHADITYQTKYGLRDWRGGGRASGRETVSRVVAGALASQILAGMGIEIKTDLVSIAGETNRETFPAMIAAARAAGDSLGGIVECRIYGTPAGLGEPVFAKLQQMLASAMLSIGGVHSFEYGDGVALANSKGIDCVDEITPDGFMSNHCGGILGGISTGQEIKMMIGFKPTPSLGIPLHSVDTEGNEVTVTTRGRHDPCIAIRGKEVVGAMAAIVILDAILMARSARIDFS